MSDTADIYRFVKEPGLLVVLCRDVIEQIDVRSEDTGVAEQEAQLRAIAKAVEELEKSGVTVPDLLRAEKTRLAASLAVRTDAKQALAQLAEGFQNILRDLRNRLGQNTASGLSKAKPRVKSSKSPTGLSKAKPHARRSKLQTTTAQVLRDHIVRALRKLGGKARGSDVIEEIGRQLEGNLLPGDSIWRESANECAWQNNAKWERFHMKQDGTLRRDSPRGVWELGEGHR